MGDLFDWYGRVKATAFLQGIDGGLPQFFDKPKHRIRCHYAFPRSAVILSLVTRVIHTVIDEVNKIGNDRLRALALEQLHKVVVGKRHIFYKNLTNDTDTRLFQILINRKFVKSLDDAAAHLLVADLAVIIRQGGNTLMRQLVLQLVCRAGCYLIRTNTVKATHHQVTEKERVHSILYHFQIYFEAFIAFKPAHTERDHGNMRISRLVEGTPDKTNVV